MDIHDIWKIIRYKKLELGPINNKTILLRCLDKNKSEKITDFIGRIR